MQCCVRCFKFVFCNSVPLCSHSNLEFVCDSVLSVILLLELCEFDLLKVLLRIWCVVVNLLYDLFENFYLRVQQIDSSALNQFIFLLHLISLAPRFIKVFQIARIIFKGLNWEKSFKVQFTPSWTQPKTFSIIIICF